MSDLLGPALPERLAPPMVARRAVPRPGELLRDERGQSSVEYALMISLISVPLFWFTWRMLKYFMWLLVQQLVANFTGVPL